VKRLPDLHQVAGCHRAGRVVGAEHAARVGGVGVEVEEHPPVAGWTPGVPLKASVGRRNSRYQAWRAKGAGWVPRP